MVYPKMQFEASNLPDRIKYPHRMFFVIPTFGEKPEVSKSMLNSVLSEVATIPSEITIFVNAGCQAEDDLFREVLAGHPQRDHVKLHFIRQTGWQATRNGRRVA